LGINELKAFMIIPGCISSLSAAVSVSFKAFWRTETVSQNFSTSIAKHTSKSETLLFN